MPMSKEALSFYQKHVFVCENFRKDGRQCCQAGANKMETNAITLLRKYLKEKKQHAKGKIRINRAGCFDLCQAGPVLVVYPDNIWYRYNNADDLKRIADNHLLNDRIVDDLLLSPQSITLI